MSGILRRVLMIMGKKRVTMGNFCLLMGCKMGGLMVNKEKSKGRGG